MADSYLLHLPDGTEYGPVDRATLETWHREGRIPADALVWPDGAPEWLTIDSILSRPVGAPEPATVTAARPSAASPAGAARTPTASARSVASASPSAAKAIPIPAPAPDEDTSDTRPPEPAPRLAPHGRRGAVIPAAHTRAIVLVGGGVLLVLVLLGGLLAVMRPFIEKRRAIAGIQRHALADRRLADPSLGFVVDLPPGWVALREDNPFVVTRGALLRLAHPGIQAFGAVRVKTDPEAIADLDRQIDALLQEQLPARPSLREEGRADVQLGRGQGRLARTTWEEDGQQLQGLLAVWADGYDYYSLDAWAPLAVGDSFAAALEELLRGIAPSGQLAARVDEAAERLAGEVPELPRDALRLLIGKRLSEGESLEGVPIDALRGVSRGIEALSPAEAEEMRQIYEKIWAPVSEEERENLARVLALVKEGHAVPAPYVQALRDVVKTGVVALPAEERARLQELSGRALEKSFLLP